MKKIITLILLLTVLTSSIGSVFAESNHAGNLTSKEPITTSSNRFRYYYTETDYTFHISSITDEEAMADAVQMAARELELAFYLVGGGLVKGAIKATASTLTRRKMAELVAKKLGMAAFVSNVAYATSIVSGFVTFDAVKMNVEKKTKIKWQENLATGKKTKMSEWVTYKTESFRRENPSSPWISNGTSYNTIRLK